MIKHCYNCGAHLQQSNCPHCQAETQPGWKYCIHCGGGLPSAKDGWVSVPAQVHAKVWKKPAEPVELPETAESEPKEQPAPKKSKAEKKPKPRPDGRRRNGRPRKGKPRPDGMVKATYCLHRSQVAWIKKQCTPKEPAIAFFCYWMPGQLLLEDPSTPTKAPGEKDRVTWGGWIPEDLHKQIAARGGSRYVRDVIERAR